MLPVFFLATGVYEIRIALKKGFQSFIALTCTLKNIQVLIAKSVNGGDRITNGNKLCSLDEGLVLFPQYWLNVCSLSKKAEYANKSKLSRRCK